MPPMLVVFFFMFVVLAVDVLFVLLRAIQNLFAGHTWNTPLIPIDSSDFGVTIHSRGRFAPGTFPSQNVIFGISTIPGLTPTRGLAPRTVLVLFIAQLSHVR